MPAMRAMRLHRCGERLRLESLERPRPGAGELLVRVVACGVCRSDLHLIDGDLPQAVLPVVPGHEIVGCVEAVGAGVAGFAPGERVGVPWLGGTCGHCGYCRAGLENLCDAPTFTGCSRDGGFAAFALADARFVFRLPDAYGCAQAAPLLCAGLIGHRSLLAAGDGRRLGLYGFGAAAHLVAQVARWQGREVFAFTRPGDAAGQAFARSVGACWAGDSTTRPPEPLDAAIIFAPVGALVPAALRATRKGGTVVCAGIHMSELPAMPYDILWGERVLRSVANLTRADGDAFLALAPRVPVRSTVTVYPLARANEAIAAVRAGAIDGAAVLWCDPDREPDEGDGPGQGRRAA